MEDLILLDGEEITEEQLKEKIEELKGNPKFLIKEVSSREFKILERLQG